MGSRPLTITGLNEATEESIHHSHSIEFASSVTIEHKKALSFSVVICTHHDDRYRDTMDAINSIQDQTISDCEIILVVDRNHALYNRFVEIFRDVSLVRIILNKDTPGLSGSRNVGVRNATGDIIAFLDDDAIADRYWLEALRDAYGDEKIIGCGGPIWPLWVSGEEKRIPEEFYWVMGCTYRGFKNVKKSVRSNFGSNMSFRRSALLHDDFDVNTGLLNDKGVGEEVDISLRILKNNPSSIIIHMPRAVVHHKIFNFRKSMKHLFNRCYQYGLNIGSYTRDIDELSGRIGKDDKDMVGYIAFESIPERIVDFLSLDESSPTYQIKIAQFVLLLLSSITIAFGMFIGKIKRINMRPE